VISGIVKDGNATVNLTFRLLNLPEFTIELCKAVEICAIASLTTIAPAASIFSNSLAAYPTKGDRLHTSSFLTVILRFIKTL
jgi:hypothetical protein